MMCMPICAAVPVVLFRCILELEICLLGLFIRVKNLAMIVDPIFGEVFITDVYNLFY